MKLQVIATRDIVANVYGQPMYVVHIGQAIRSFGDEAQRKEPNNVLAQHPEDFELWHLGEWDDETAEYTELKPRKQLAAGANYRSVK
jgi:hypothetical protein